MSAGHVAAAGDPLGRGAAGPRAPPPTRGGAAICFLRPDAGVPRDPGAVHSSTRGQPAKEPRFAPLTAPRPPPLDPGGSAQTPLWLPESTHVACRACWDLLATSVTGPSLPPPFIKSSVREKSYLPNVYVPFFLPLSICCPKLHVA